MNTPDEVEVLMSAVRRLVSPRTGSKAAPLVLKPEQRVFGPSVRLSSGTSGGAATRQATLRRFARLSRIAAPAPAKTRLFSRRAAEASSKPLAETKQVRATIRDLLCEELRETGSGPLRDAIRRILREELDRQQDQRLRG